MRVVFKLLTGQTAQNSHILRHPIYAGAYVFGRTKSLTTSTIDGERRTVQRRLRRDDWEVLIRDKVPSYITWEQWEQNQQKLQENSTKISFGVSRGATLMAGRITCGKCGAGMTVHYRDGVPVFECIITHMQFGLSRCQSFNGRWLESLIEELVLKAMEPASVELGLSAASDIEQDRARLKSYHQQSVDRARYDADLARRRYEEVDPSNRLVAAELEKRWESALGVQRKSEEEMNCFLLERPTLLTTDQHDSIRDLSNDFAALWNSEATSPKDRQDLVRILIDRIVVDVVDGSECLDVAVHWSGGFISRYQTRRSVMCFDDLKDADELLSRTAELYNSGYPRSEIISARQDTFTETSINALFLTLRRKGMIGSKPTLCAPWWQSGGLSQKIGINASTLTGWRHRGWI